MGNADEDCASKQLTDTPKFGDWSCKLYAHGVKNYALELVQKAGDATRQTLTFQKACHALGAIVAIAVTWALCFRVRGTFKTMQDNNIKIVFEQFAIMYPSIVGVLLGAGCVLVNIMNAAASAPLDRGFFVPTITTDGGAYKLVHIEAAADVTLVSEINSVLDATAAVEGRLDLERFKKTRGIQSASLTRAAANGDCAVGIDIVIGSLKPASSAPPSSHDTIDKLIASFQHMTKVERDLVQQCTALKVGREQLDAAAQQENALATALTEQSKFLDFLRDFDGEESSNEFGKDPLKKVGERYIKSVGDFDQSIDALRAFIGGATTDATATPGLDLRLATDSVRESVKTLGAPRLIEKVDEVMASFGSLRGTPNGYTIAVYNSSPPDAQKDTLLMTRVTEQLVKQLLVREEDRGKGLLLKERVYESVVYAIALLTTIRYSWEFLLQPPPDSEVKDCLRAAALINGFDVGAPDAPDAKQKLDAVKAALISHVRSNRKLRADHLSCQLKTKMVGARNVLLVGFKLSTLLLVFLLIITAVRSHFGEADAARDEEVKALRCIRDELRVVVGALSKSPADLGKLDTSMDSLIAARDRCSLLSDGTQVKKPALGRMAKYALLAALSLTAVLVAVQSARPGSQVQRMKELMEYGGGGSVTGGGLDVPQNKELLMELETLQAEGNPLQTQIITLCILLAASGYACMALVGEMAVQAE
jgi:hypothetical protein